MFDNFRKTIKHQIFNWQVRDILNTPSIENDSNSTLLIVSQVCHRDVFMYLLAIKSLVRFLVPRKIYAIDDMTLTSDDKKQLRMSIQDICIIPIKEIDGGPCPRGGTWERLLFIADLAKQGYVVQIDCDTLTLKQPDEVIDSIKSRRSFTQGSYLGKRIVPLKEACIKAKSLLNNSNPHVQLMAESNFDRLRGYETKKYVRGCSGFAGFGDGTLSRKEIEDFSHQIQCLIGKLKWNEWGSEQVTSNFIVANSLKSIVLPFPEYGYLSKELKISSCKFIHFLGTYRFNNGTYARLGKTIIDQLKNS